MSHFKVLHLGVFILRALPVLSSQLSAAAADRQQPLFCSAAWTCLALDWSFWSTGTNLSGLLLSQEIHQAFTIFIRQLYPCVCESVHVIRGAHDHVAVVDVSSFHALTASASSAGPIIPIRNNRSYLWGATMWVSELTAELCCWQIKTQELHEEKWRCYKGERIRALTQH